MPIQSISLNNMQDNRGGGGGLQNQQFIRSANLVYSIKTKIDIYCTRNKSHEYKGISGSRNYQLYISSLARIIYFILQM